MRPFRLLTTPLTAFRKAHTAAIPTAMIPRLSKRQEANSNLASYAKSTHFPIALPYAATPVNSLQKRHLSRGPAIEDLATKIIKAITEKKPERLFSLLMATQSSVDVPHGTFGPDGIYSIKDIYHFLKSSPALDIALKDLSKKRTLDTRAMEGDYPKFLDPTNHLSLYPVAKIIRAFDKVARESSAIESFNSIIEAQSYCQCNARTLISALIQGGKITRPHVRQATFICIRFQRHDIINLIDFMLTITEFNKAAEGVRQNSEIDKQDKILLSSALEKFFDSENAFRALMKKHEGLEYTPKELDLAKTHKALRLFIEYPESIEITNKAYVALIRKNYKDFEESLSDLSRVKSGGALSMFMDYPMTLQGELLPSLAIKIGGERFIKAIIDRGFDVTKFDKENLIIPDKPYILSAIDVQNPEVVKTILRAWNNKGSNDNDNLIDYATEYAIKLSEKEPGDSTNRVLYALLNYSLKNYNEKPSLETLMQKEYPAKQDPLKIESLEITTINEKRQQENKYGNNPEDISRLDSLCDIIEADDRASLFAFIMSNRPEDLPPLFLPDHLVAIMDLRQVITSDVFLEDLSEDYQESEDPNKTTDLAIWYQKVIESKVSRQEFFINIRLFDSLASKQPVARCIEDCIRAYNVTQNPILEVKIEYLIARIAASTHNKNDTLREIETMLSKQSIAKGPKTVKATGVIDMATRSARLSANTGRVREIATQAFDSQSHEASAGDLSHALTYYNAYAMDFEFMLRRSNPRNKSHRAIDMESIDPVLIIYLENPEMLAPMKLARDSLRAGNLDHFIMDLEGVDPTLLQEFLNKSPIVLEDLSNFTTASVIAGPKFVKHLIKKGLDLNSDNRDISVMPFSSAIMTAIATSQPEVVELILKSGFDKSKPQFLMNKQRDPLEYATKALLETTADRIDNATLIVKMMQEHYQEKPGPNPRDPDLTTKEKNPGTRDR